MIENKNDRVAWVMGCFIDIFVPDTPAKHRSISPKPANMINNVAAPDFPKK
jgi:hypothetical protein